MMHKVTFVFEDIRLPSNNQIWEQKHWRYRKRFADEWRLHMRSKIDPNTVHTYDAPVIIRVWAEYKHPAVDVDNICLKPMIDAMKGFLFKDDSPAYVAEIRLVSRTSTRNHAVVEVMEA